MGSVRERNYDILIVGAGLSGLSSLYNIRRRFPNLSVRVLEAAPSVGGTWYWNCYPGARFDSETISYQLTWDKELLQQWNWTETYAKQEETLRYIERFADKNSLRDDIQFNTSVVAARWQEGDRCWVLTDAEGFEYRGTFFISCLGVLTTPTVPKILGIEGFQGQSFHTSRFPRDLVPSRDFAGKRVGVVGTGATGIQTITTIAREVDVQSLTVFQRTATWAAPLRNAPISPEQMKEIKANYDSIFQRCADTTSGFIHSADPRKSADVSQEERLRLWDEIYEKPGFAKWLSTFSDTYTDREANRLYSDYMASKIRARVDDPVIAEKLIPRNHGFGTRRVPLESGYYETFNRPNVHLVDIKETPLVNVEGKDLITSDGKRHELDVLIFATGFDAITGAFTQIDFTSKSGRPLIGISSSPKGANALWLNHRPTTSMGILTHDLPNMFMVLGPHQPFGNIPRSIETAVKVVMGLLEYCQEHGYTYVEATKEACDQWGEHVWRCGQGQLSNEVDSWMSGVNTNVEGKTERFIARYAGSAIDYRKRCAENQQNGWPLHVFA